MPRRPTRDRAEAELWSAPAFPRPVRSFAGRRRELERILAAFDQETLFLVYGVAGIGKSELVYRAIEDARARPPWAEARPILVDVRPDASMTRTVAQLLAAVGATPEPRRGQPTEEAHLSEQLEVLAGALEAEPRILFIDNVHHLPPAQVAEGLRYLARRVRRSRVFVASRQEIRLPPDAPLPVVTTLGPLDREAAVQLLDILSGRMQVPRPDPDEMLRTAHGSPFHIRQMLVRHEGEHAPLDESLRELSEPARRILLDASIAQRRLPVAAMRRAWSNTVDLDHALGELEQRFVVDVEQDRLVVHDLIREALLAQVSADELAAAHERAADLCIDELGTGDSASLLLAVDAVNHAIAAGRHALAWQLIERWHSPLAGTGSEHLLLASLETLRDQLPDRATTIDLLIARGMVRASLFEDAAAVLARTGEPTTPDENTRYHLLAGEIAQRTGDLAHADEHYQSAIEHAPGEAARFRARLQSATIAIYAGDSPRARAIADAALHELTAPTSLDRARCGWVHTVSLVFEERHERVAEQARRTREDLAGARRTDLVNRLAMLETLACFECDEMRQAREATRMIDDAGLRQRVAGLYRAITAYADGETRQAATALVDAHEYLRSHGDTVYAYLAGYYASLALASLGKLGEAQSLARRSAELAGDAGLVGPAAQAKSQQALLAAEAVQVPEAHRLAAEVLASEHANPRSRARAHCAHARGYLIQGDITRALEHIELARAQVADPELEAAHIAIDLELASVDLIGGNLERAVEYAERVVEHYRGRSRDFESARALLVLAAAYIARGRRTDLLFAERHLAQIRTLAERGELTSVQVGCAILSAALARRGRSDRAADELLADALRELDPERGSLYASVLMAAIEGGAVSWAVPGVVALLAHLGFSDAVDRYLVDPHGRRAATDQDVTREQSARQLFVDEVRSVIVARGGQFEINGRPMQCSLLSVLIQARGEPVAPDDLYKRVWGVNEYHPLQHRNALYVAINRLRKSLREALPEHDVIERSGGGWRLNPAVDACVALAVRTESR